MVPQKRESGRQKKSEPINLIYGKMAPQATDLEGALLGAIMLEPGALDTILEIIQTPEAFYSDANQRVYSSILRINARGGKIDFLTVCEDLRKNSELEIVGGSYYVTCLTRDVVSTAHIEEWARIVMEKFILRDVIRFAGEIIGECYDNSGDALEVIDKVGDFSIISAERVIKRQYEHISKGLDKLVIETLELCEQESKLSGVPSGFKILDSITGGWQKTDLIIIAARPAVGKTAFVLNITIGAVYEFLVQSVPIDGVAVFSLEMSTKQLLQRFAANMCDIELSKITKGGLSESEKFKFQQTCARLRELPIYFDDTPALDIIQLKAKARKLKKKHNIGLIIIDYLQLMKGDVSRGAGAGNREQEISKISRDLKELAKVLEIPIIALSQMSRGVEGRADNVPRLSDLRESGAIEQDADLVIFLYENSKEILKKNPYKRIERHVSIAKHRNGKVADLIYDFDGEKQRFGNEDRTVIDIPHEEVISSSTKGMEAYTFENNLNSEIAAPPSTQDGVQDEFPF